MDWSKQQIRSLHIAAGVVRASMRPKCAGFAKLTMRRRGCARGIAAIPALQGSIDHSGTTAGRRSIRLALVPAARNAKPQWRASKPCEVCSSPIADSLA
jgi:hypothetical protein